MTSPQDAGPTAAATPDTSAFTPLDSFARRHHGQTDADLQAMLDAVGVGSVEALIDQTIPKDIRLDKPLQLVGLDADVPLGESGALERLQSYAALNEVKTSMIGMGYHGTITPPVILRNVLENPLWYTPYTPYQAEIAQGRLEALLNFQTMVSDLTGLPLAGASLLDEATAAAEAMAMCYAIGRGKKPAFFAAEDCHPQTLAVVKTRADSMGIALTIGGVDAIDLESETYCGVLVSYPATNGCILDFSSLTAKAHEHGALVVAATDLLACCLITPPGEWGADIAVGSSQRFGVPMGYGGPHAAFLSTKEEYARKMPGRLIGVSKDSHGNLAYRMAIQTREQHIKRDKATSNICTAQVLLAITAGLYATYHGPDGLKEIAQRVHGLAVSLASRLTELGLAVDGRAYFDTVSVCMGEEEAKAVLQRAAEAGVNLRIVYGEIVNICLDETTTIEDLGAVVAAFKPGERFQGTAISDRPLNINPKLPQRTSAYLTHPVFNRYHTEHELLRYTTRLISKDYGLAQGMIPLGSCTMKLNAAAEMIPITWEKFANLHPYCPAEQAVGYRKLFDDLESWLAEITGFAAVSLQPNAGSQGEYAGLMAIRAYHLAHADAESRSGEASGTRRTKCLIPTSAHGTNPASAVIAGMQVVPVLCRSNGDIDLEDLEKKAEQCGDELSCLMITYPSTHGVFEDTIRAACQIVHDRGGLVYMDGANMNAQVGLTSPGNIGADVCHLNLHKTFCIPHGGGGPGMGPIGVNEKLAPYLPGNPLDSNSYAISAAPFGSPMILPISWMYIAMMGSAGLTQATQRAILNANYMAARLRGHFDILYTGPAGTVAHEFIVDCRPFDKSAHVTVDDIAKRLMDYGFHAPTMSWPVSGTLMIEPTESESKFELDRFCDAMIQIRAEIRAIEEGRADRADNVLKNAPHTAASVTGSEWTRPYTREEAAFPAPWTREHKFWPSVSRIDNGYGDKNLMCTCPSVEEMASAV